MERPISTLEQTLAVVALLKLLTRPVVDSGKGAYVAGQVRTADILVRTLDREYGGSGHRVGIVNWPFSKRAVQLEGAPPRKIL